MALIILEEDRIGVLNFLTRQIMIQKNSKIVDLPLLLFNKSLKSLEFDALELLLLELLLLLLELS